VNRYLIGADFIGASAASDYGADYGPLSPAQLATLDRALTPAEQKAVDDYQSSAADQTLVTERAKGGPQSVDVSVTPKGATIRAVPQPRAQPIVRVQPKVLQAGMAPAGLAWWQIALLILGGGAVVVGGSVLFGKYTSVAR